MVVRSAVEQLNTSLVLKQPKHGLRHRAISGEVFGAIEYFGGRGAAQADGFGQHDAGLKDIRAEPIASVGNEAVALPQKC
jgi:hypothetical protein